MCRLYGFRATEPTTVECTLVSAQNALIVQSQRDQEGHSNAHGWGVAVYPNGGLPHIERQAWAAYHGEHFREAAARAHARTVVAHVRRATMGVPALENTHPFSYRRWTFAHNGTMRAFGKIRGRMRAAITPEHHAALQGTTDSEHIFYFLLSLRGARARPVRMARSGPARDHPPLGHPATDLAPRGNRPRTALACLTGEISGLA